MEDSFGLAEPASTPAPAPPPRKKNAPKPPEKPVHLRDVAHTLFADKLKKRLSTRKSKGRSFHYRLPDISQKLTDFASPKVIKSMSKQEVQRQEMMIKFILEEAAYLSDLRLISDVILYYASICIQANFLCQHFAEPLKDKQLISHEEFNELFGNIHRLIKKVSL